MFASWHSVDLNHISQDHRPASGLLKHLPEGVIFIWGEPFSPKKFHLLCVLSHLLGRWGMPQRQHLIWEDGWNGKIHLFLTLFWWFCILNYIFFMSLNCYSSIFKTEFNLIAKNIISNLCRSPVTATANTGQILYPHICFHHHDGICRLYKLQPA